ncbi:MAG: GNAT family N-acetyltransferase [Gorillibacterium sp.]|nr:GNAT family N-acetyltransferase [Gorillibacterium sp.]
MKHPDNSIIRPAKVQDIPTIAQLYQSCMKSMQEQGSDQWNETYPTITNATEDILAGTLFVLEEQASEENGQILGVITLDELDVPAYGDMIWSETHGKPLLLHRLAVHPLAQGRGIAKRLVLFAEDHARKLGCTCIRFDTYSRNRSAIGLYLGLGYNQVAGEIHFPGREDAFFCYEKLVYKC